MALGFGGVELDEDIEVATCEVDVSRLVVALSYILPTGTCLGSGASSSWADGMETVSRVKVRVNSHARLHGASRSSKAWPRSPQRGFREPRS